MAGRRRTREARELGLVCGAYARSTGKPCQCKLLLRGARCKFHGGMSTGPRTPEGKERALRAMREGWQRWQDQARQARETLYAHLANALAGSG